MKLPNNCRLSPISLSKKNNNWIIFYTFYSPDIPNGKRFQIRINKDIKKEKTLKAKELISQKIIDDLTNEFLKGFNPVLKDLKYCSSEVNSETPFIEALNIAYSKIKGVSGTLIDIKSVVTGVSLAATKLGIANKPVIEVTRKYFKMIFEQCRNDNPRFSAHRQNKYRAYLMKLYKELIEMEAVEVNPLREIKKETETKKQRRMFTIEERKSISYHLKTYHYEFYRAVILFFHSGSRGTEIMRVKDKHVDIENQRILYTIMKGGKIVEVYRPIKDSVLNLWKELKALSGDPENYLMSRGLVPGVKPIRSDQLMRRWGRHIKGKIYEKAEKRYNIPRLNIDVDFYALKHLNTTEVMDELDDIEEVRKLTGHTSGAMIKSIYDKNYQSRKDDKIKKVNNQF